jgi:hypothetical protein
VLFPIPFEAQGSALASDFEVESERAVRM